MKFKKYIQTSYKEFINEARRPDFFDYDDKKSKIEITEKLIEDKSEMLAELNVSNKVLNDYDELIRKSNKMLTDSDTMKKKGTAYKKEAQEILVTEFIDTADRGKTILLETNNTITSLSKLSVAGTSVKWKDVSDILSSALIAQLGAVDANALIEDAIKKSSSKTDPKASTYKVDQIKTQRGPHATRDTGLDPNEMTDDEVVPMEDERVEEGLVSYITDKIKKVISKITNFFKTADKHLAELNDIIKKAEAKA